MTPASSCPWQLYLFAFTNLAMAIPLTLAGVFGGGICNLMFAGGACNTLESIYSLYVGICALYVFALFYMLTFGNKRKLSQLNCLKMLASNCTVATFCGVICIGSSAMGGVERQVLHIVDMIYFFALFISLVCSMTDDSPIAGRCSPFSGLRFLNPKALVLLIGIAVAVKLFILTDFMNMMNFLDLDDDTMVTDRARALQSLMAILMFEVFCAAMFALSYGSAKDQEQFLYVVIAMMIVSGILVIPTAGYFQAGLIKQGLITAVVFLLLCMFSVYQSRKQQGEGYEAISTVV